MSPSRAEEPVVALPLVVSGAVVRGDGRGRQIGFPTANVTLVGGSRVPPEGVYAGWLRRAAGDVHAAAVSIGRRSTFYGEEGELVLEAYVLEFEGDLYGEVVEVGLEVAVRGQARFDSVDELVARMHLDVEAVAAEMRRRLHP